MRARSTATSPEDFRFDRTQECSIFFLIVESLRVSIERQTLHRNVFTVLALKCGWSYATQCIDNGEVKVVNLKKKLWEQIITAAEDLGDPTDPETGWDICFKRVKTGPLPYNVEYQLQALKCKPRALTEEERAAIADLKSMDDVMTRPTADAQKELLDRVRNHGDETDDEALDAEFNVG